jgi:hypothetical protein
MQKMQAQIIHLSDWNTGVFKHIINNQPYYFYSTVICYSNSRFYISERIILRFLIEYYLSDPRVQKEMGSKQ